MEIHPLVETNQDEVNLFDFGMLLTQTIYQLTGETEAKTRSRKKITTNRKVEDDNATS